MQNLERVSKKSLLQIEAFLGFKGWSVLSKDHIVRQLTRNRNLPWPELSLSGLISDSTGLVHYEPIPALPMAVGGSGIGSSQVMPGLRLMLPTLLQLRDRIMEQQTEQGISKLKRGQP